MADIGYSSLFSAFISYFFASLLFFLGIRKRDKRMHEAGKRAVFIGSIFIIISSISLIYLLIIKDFEVEYVASYTSKKLPLLYSISAFWAGMEGSMLFWVLILCVYFLIYLFSSKTDNIHKIISYIFISLVTLFFLFVTVFLTNPFKILPFTPSDGKGLNPLLQNYWMLIHPVTLYLGYVGFTIPFAYASSVLIKGERKGWTEEIRKWTLISWLFLTIGIVFGGRWAYVELGWGGYWAWDPVENASFLPWLTATAFVHTLLIQETKNALKLWNLALIIITFILVVTGTYITRSGALSSVHAFAESRLGPYFGSLVFLTFIFMIFSLIKFNRHLKKDKEQFSVFGPEGLILLLLFSLVAITLVVLIGTFYPIISGLITGQKITVGQDFFVKTTGPFFIIILLLMGLYPFTYKKVSKIFLLPSLLIFVLISFIIYIKFSKHPGAWLGYGSAGFALSSVIYIYLRDIKKYGLILRKTGIFLIHSGIAVTAIGIISSSGFKTQKEFALKENDSVKFLKYEVIFKGLIHNHASNYDEVRGIFLIKENNKIKGKLTPSLRFYHNWEQPSAEMDVLPLLEGDIYGVIQGWDENKTVYFQIFHNPLIQLVWMGTTFIFIGGILVLLEKRKKR